MLKLQEYRLKNTLSIEDMAKYTGYSSSALKHIEVGERHAPEDVIRTYCKVLGITPNDIYDVKTEDKHTIPLYKVINKNKLPISLDKNAGTIEISSEQYNKKYSFALQAWSMDNNPKIFTGDVLYFKFDNNIRDGDVILCLYKNKPLIRLFGANKDRFSLKAFNMKYKTIFFTDMSDLEVVGRLVEIHSILRKGGNPWPNGR